MKNDLKNLTQILFGEADLSKIIYDDTYKIDTLTQQFNRALGIKKGASDSLVSTHLSETVIAPLPFYGVMNKAKFDLVYMNLTPDFDNARIHLEKQSAGDYWENYYNFYTSQKVFDFMKEDNSHNYRNLIKLLFALNVEHEAGMISIDDIEKKLSGNDTDVLKTLLEDQSVLVAHVVPCHSKAFDTNMNGINRLRDTMPTYKKYLTTLMNYIKTNTEDGGLIVSTQFADSRVIHSLLAEDDAIQLLENALFTLQKWDNKFAILFNDQLISRHGLRTEFEIDKVMSLVKSITLNENTEAHIQELENYTNSLIEQRTEDEFKERGKRIKGAKLKGIRVKKLRADKLTDLEKNLALRPDVNIEK